MRTYSCDCRDIELNQGENTMQIIKKKIILTFCKYKSICELNPVSSFLSLGNILSKSITPILLDKALQ